MTAMFILLTIITILLAGFSAYNVYILNLLRNELKQKNDVIRVYKQYKGDVNLP